MAITVNEVTKNIFVPQADLTNLGGGLYTHDTEAFRLELRDWESSVPGSWRSITHLHNTTVTIAGTVLARVIEIINGYTITYEDGQYRVTLLGSNNNFVDVATVNQVSIVPTNSAGLIVTGTSGLTAAEAADLLLARELMEADQFFDQSEGLLHYYRRGTTVDLITPKGVTGEQTVNDVLLVE